LGDDAAWAAGTLLVGHDTDDELGSVTGNLLEVLEAFQTDLVGPQDL
jgi:hypothetical protein